MAIQDKFDNIEEIKEICEKAINTKKKINEINKSDGNYTKLCQKIAKYNILLQEKFDQIDESDRNKIYTGFGTNNININSFNKIDADNFGNIIDTILKSWIIVNWDKDLTQINLPNSIKKNIIAYKKEDNGIIHNISKRNKSKNGNVIIFDQNDMEENFVKRIYEKITILNKKINAWKFKYKLNVIRKFKDNLFEFKRYNNWINLPLLIHKRSYSYNKSKFKEFSNNGNIYDESFNKASYSNNIKNIQILLNNNDINFIKQLSKTCRIKVDNITSWYRNKYPIDYINKFNFIKNQYNLIYDKYNFHIERNNINTNPINRNSDIMDICSIRNKLDMDYDL